MRISRRGTLFEPRGLEEVAEKIILGKDRMPQLDLLRGVAILMVLMFHQVVQFRSEREVPWLASAFFRIGWTGVNLFFVLSGFLVGGMLLSEAEGCGKLNIRRFLVRRAFKIWPSYYVLLAVTAIQSASLGRDLRVLWPCLVHVQNYNMSALVLLPHSWSLAVEEHFYLLLPLTLTAIPRQHRRACLAFAWAILSIGCAISRALDRPVFPTFPTHHNLDSLAWGVVLASMVSARTGQRRTAQPALLLASGIGLLALSFYQCRAGTAWASALVPIGLYFGYGQVLLGVVGLPSEWFRGRLARATARVGFYSYAIYLWHLTFPLLVGYALGAAATSWGMSPLFRWYLVTPVYIALAIGVGVLTSRTIEQPFLGLRDRLCPRRTVDE